MNGNIGYLLLAVIFILLFFEFFVAYFSFFAIFQLFFKKELKKRTLNNSLSPWFRLEMFIKEKWIFYLLYLFKKIYIIYYILYIL